MKKWNRRSGPCQRTEINCLILRLTILPIMAERFHKINQFRGKTNQRLNWNTLNNSISKTRKKPWQDYSNLKKIYNAWFPAWNTRYKMCENNFKMAVKAGHRRRRYLKPQKYDSAEWVWETHGPNMWATKEFQRKFN